MDEGRPAPDENAGMRLPRQTGQGLRRQDCRQAEPARKPHFSLGHGYGQEIPGLGELHRACTRQRHTACSDGVHPLLWQREAGKRRENAGRIVRKQTELRNIPPAAQCIAEHPTGRGNGTPESEGYRIRGTCRKPEKERNECTGTLTEP